jgi:hypothetical protein
VVGDRGGSRLQPSVWVGVWIVLSQGITFPWTLTPKVLTNMLLYQENWKTVSLCTTRMGLTLLSRFLVLSDAKARVPGPGFSLHPQGECLLIWRYGVPYPPLPRGDLFKHLGLSC